MIDVQQLIGAMPPTSGRSGPTPNAAQAEGGFQAMLKLVGGAAAPQAGQGTAGDPAPVGEGDPGAAPDLADLEDLAPRIADLAAAAQKRFDAAAGGAERARVMRAFVTDLAETFEAAGVKTASGGLQAVLGQLATGVASTEAPPPETAGPVALLAKVAGVEPGGAEPVEIAAAVVAALSGLERPDARPSDPGLPVFVDGQVEGPEPAAPVDDVPAVDAPLGEASKVDVPEIGARGPAASELDDATTRAPGATAAEATGRAEVVAAGDRSRPAPSPVPAEAATAQAGAGPVPAGDGAGDVVSPGRSVPVGSAEPATAAPQTVAAGATDAPDSDALERPVPQPSRSTEAAGPAATRVLAQPLAERPPAEQPVTQAPTATPDTPEAARAVPEGAEPQIRASEKPAAAALQSVSGADPARPVPAPVAPAMPQAEVVEQRPLASVDPVLTPKQAADASPAFAFARRVAAQLHGHSFEEGKTRVELTPRGLGDIEVEVAHDDQGKLRIVLRAENPAVLTAFRNDRDMILDVLRDSGVAVDAGELGFEAFGGHGQSDGYSEGQEPGAPPAPAEMPGIRV